jgi:hypothetical protein
MLSDAETAQIPRFGLIGDQPPISSGRSPACEVSHIGTSGQSRGF